MSKSYQAVVRTVTSPCCLDLAPAKKPDSSQLRRVFIAYVTDKRLANLENKSEDVGAFYAREYIRKRLLGDVITVEEAYVTKDGRSYVTIKDSEGNDPYLQLISEGILEPREGDSAVAEEYMSRNQDARTNNLGCYAAKIQQNLNRRVNIDFTEADLAKAVANGNVSAIVEKVSNALNIYVYLPKPRHHYLRVSLAGISKCGRIDLDEKATEILKVLLTSKDVTCRVLGLNNYDVPVVKMEYQGNDISAYLLSQGLAKYNEWTGVTHPEPQSLIEAQKSAQGKGLNVWAGHIFSQPRPENQETFTAIVTSIQGPTAFSALLPDGSTERFFLSSTFGPKFRFSDIENSDEWGLEGWLKLRGLILGKSVNIVVDYTKEDRKFVTVKVDDINVTEHLLLGGFIKLARHARDDPNRSGDYFSLMEIAEKGAQHRFAAGKPAPKHHLTDYDTDKSFSKSQTRLGVFIKNGEPKKLAAIPIIVRGPNRFKMFLPEMDTIVPFAIENLLCPENIASPYVDSLANGTFTIAISNINKGGVFIGRIWENGSDIVPTIIAHGLGQPTDRCNISTWNDAAKRAEEQGIGLWSKKQIEAARVLLEESASSTTIGRCCQTEQRALIKSVSSDFKFWVVVADAHENLLNECDIDRRNTVGRGKFAALPFGTHYRRVYVNSTVGDMARVSFVDAGEEGEVALADLSPVRDNISAIPRQAALCTLASTLLFKLSIDEVREMMMDLAGSEVLLRTYGTRDDVCLADFRLASNTETFIEFLLEEGLANVDRRYPIVNSKYDDISVEASAKRIGSWASDNVYHGAEEAEEFKKLYA